MAAHVIADEGDQKTKWERPTTQRSMPPGEIITVEDEALRCYTFEEGKQIALLVNDYNDMFNQSIRWESIRLEYESKVTGLKLQLKASDGLATQYKDNAEWWRGLWKSTRNELESNAKLERWKWIPWVLPAIVGVAWGITSAVD